MTSQHDRDSRELRELCAQRDAARATVRQQAERIAELEARVHTCGPTCSKAGCINRRVTAERDQLRAEVERLREFFEADMAVAKIYDEVSPGLTTPPGQDHYDRLGVAIDRRVAAVRAIESAKEQQ